jgi:general secretion pathway protein E
MLNIPKHFQLELYPLVLDDFDAELGIRNGLLPTTIDDKPRLAIDANRLSDAIGLAGKIGSTLPLAIVDTDSFALLQARYQDQRSDGSGLYKLDGEGGDFIAEEVALAEFLRNSVDLLSNEESAPVIKLTNSIFYQAIRRGASDIHIETHELSGVVRFRIDGTLIKQLEIEKTVVSLVISRLKIISNLDIAERRIPQDGRTKVKIAGNTLDIRVSILPTYHGERAVMRILSHSTSIPTLEDLGFTKTIAQGLESMLLHSHGMILVTGPTGSGKSTSLHAFLQKLASPEKNVITIEDPVEYNADNINQIQVNNKAGLTFSTALRSVLRQDPDIVMVGEIRDKETAQIAVQSALTGHLLLSTLHTNNATGAITRLADMGVENYLIASTLLGVLAQRLVRKLCIHCKSIDTPTKTLRDEIEIDEHAVVYKAVGCEACGHSGYAGRTVVGELFILDDEMKELVAKSSNDAEIRARMKAKGMVLLAHELLRLVIDGTTSIDEAIRVGIKDA